LKIKELQMT